MTDHNDETDGYRTTRTRTRRRFLAASGVGALAAVGGCSGVLQDGGSGGEASGNDSVTLSSFRGSGALVEQRDAPGGTSIEDLPELSGELKVYLGGGEGGLYDQLFGLLERRYPDFSITTSRQPSRDLANTIIAEHEENVTQADLFMAIDAGSLGAVAEAGATQQLPDEVRDPVPEDFQDSEGRWVGFAGRARAIPYNTNQISADEIPDTVHDFPGTEALADSMGWGPSYGAFQSFVTAMRLDRGDEETKQWLQSMQDLGVTTYQNEWYVSNGVADGEQAAGFANHYYALRVRNSRSDAPIDLAFTQDDAGALVNVSGAEILSGTEKTDLAGNFLRHVLSAEAQEFFATRTFAYPMIPGVEPVGGLPTVDELSPPDINLTDLADVSGTVDMLREVGVL